MRAYWDKEVPGAADTTLLIAERVESYEEVWAYVDRMPVFDVPDGDEPGQLAAQGGHARPELAVPGRRSPTGTSSAPSSSSA